MTGPAVLVLDNVDSFTFMLVDFLASLGANVTVARNDEIDVGRAMEIGRRGILISPGPGTPHEAGISIELAARCIADRRPLLGVCLGHQAIAVACGSRVARTHPVHGKVATVSHDGTGLFKGLPSPFSATRYHSLGVPEPRLPLMANAWSTDGVVMAMRHTKAPVHGVQFHPESVASDQGKPLLSAFLAAIHANA